MLKRFALMIAATAVLAVPASSAFGASAPRPTGALPEEACFAAYPAVVQPALCGTGNGAPGKAG
jgi:hypothetical protein